MGRSNRNYLYQANDGRGDDDDTETDENRDPMYRDPM
jgi:hypothetical protein